MKKVLFLLCFLSIALFSCKGNKNPVDTESKENIENLEKENLELETLEKDIEKDIKEIDDLLENVDNL